MDADDITTLSSGLGELVTTALALLAVVMIAYLGATWLTRLQIVLRERRSAERFVAWLPLVQIGLWVLAGFIAAAVLTSAPPIVIIAILVPAAAALVVASRDLVRDTIAGAVLAFEHAILAGDSIDVATPAGEIRGKVLAVGVRRTRLRRADGDDVLIPNQVLLNSTVRTTRGHVQDSVVDIELDVDEALTTAEFPRIRAVAREAASVSRYASPNRRPEVHLEPTASGRYRVTIQAFAFSPEFARHLRTDVVSMFQENLDRKSDD